MRESRHLGHVLWAAWAALLTALALIEVLLMPSADAVHHELSSAGSAWWPSVGAVALVLSSLFALRVLPRAAHGVRQGSAQSDLLLVGAGVTWMIFVALQAWLANVPGREQIHHLSYQAYQATVALVSCFLMTAITRLSRIGQLVWLLQWLGGAALLVWLHADPDASPFLWTIWQVGNIVLTSVLFLFLGVCLLAGSDLRAWLMMSAAWFAWGLALSDFSGAHQKGLDIGVTHLVFTVWLVVVWLVVSGRIGSDGRTRDHPASGSPMAELVQAFAHSGLYGYDAAGATAGQAGDEAAGHERRRIAQELHDGVGSQLVGILASLDRRQERERELASLLEQCLLDVKILVDAIDDADESVIDVLGRLRYRVQPALERLGITLHWSVPPGGPLETIRGDRSRQVLRVAQEALANAMRHSMATGIWLRCELDPTGRALLLDIRDNGAGFDVRARDQRGRGMAGMRRRAAAVGGVLEIDSVRGQGTHVRLTMPLSSRFSS